MTASSLVGGQREAFAAVCAPRAEVFRDGVGFVRGWSTARRAADDLAAYLERAGLAEAFSGLRADVSVAGDGLVCLDSVTADAAQQLADLLLRGLCVELDRSLNASRRPPAA